MKLTSGQKLGFVATSAEGDSKLRGYHFVVLGALTMSLAACATAPLKKCSEPKLCPDSQLQGSNNAAAAPPLPEEPIDDQTPEVITVPISKPKAPIVANDAVMTDPKARADADSGGEVDRERGAEDPLQAMGGEGGIRTEGASTAPGGLGIASNAKSGHRGSGAPQPLPDSSGATNTGGTQIAAASEVRGTIDKAEIRRVVTAHASDVKRCYEQGLARRPDLEGRIAVKFTIGKTGTVVAVTVTESSLNDRQTEQCITRVTSKWVFPKPTGEGLVTVSYPFILKSAD